MGTGGLKKALLLFWFFNKNYKAPLKLRKMCDTCRGMADNRLIPIGWQLFLVDFFVAQPMRAKKGVLSEPLTIFMCLCCSEKVSTILLKFPKRSPKSCRALPKIFQQSLSIFITVFYNKFASHICRSNGKPCLLRLNLKTLQKIERFW